MTEEVEFSSGAVSLRGELTNASSPVEKVPGLVLAHGFAGAQYPKLTHELAKLGYAILDFHFRSYGRSGGAKGRVVPAEQVDDLRAAVTFLSTRREVDSDRIGVVGSSLGGSVAIEAAAIDERIKACVAGCPLATGESVLRMQYDTREKYDAFMRRVENARAAGSLIGRFDIVSIPPALRTVLPAGTPMAFTPETVTGFLDLKTLDVVSHVKVPLLLIHAVDDEVVPLEESRRLSARAGSNCEFVEVASGNHFIFGKDDVIEAVANWLTRHFPARAVAAGRDGACQ